MSLTGWFKKKDKLHENVTNIIKKTEKHTLESLNIYSTCKVQATTAQKFSKTRRPENADRPT